MYHSEGLSETTALGLVHDLWVLERGLRASPRVDRAAIRKFVFDWMVQEIYPHNPRAMTRRPIGPRDYQPGQFRVWFVGQSAPTTSRLRR